MKNVSWLFSPCPFSKWVSTIYLRVLSELLPSTFLLVKETVFGPVLLLSKVSRDLLHQSLMWVFNIAQVVQNAPDYWQFEALQSPHLWRLEIYLGVPNHFKKFSFWASFQLISSTQWKTEAVPYGLMNLAKKSNFGNHSDMLRGKRIEPYNSGGWSTVNLEIWTKSLGMSKVLSTYFRWPLSASFSVRASTCC